MRRVKRDLLAGMDVVALGRRLRYARPVEEATRGPRLGADGCPEQDDHREEKS